MSRKKKELPYEQQVQWAVAICTPLNCVVARSARMYEVATVKGEGVQLVIYPHRTSAGHYHLRVRDNGSSDKTRARRVMHALDQGEGLPEGERWKVKNTCTFSVKLQPYI